MSNSLAETIKQFFKEELKDSGSEVEYSIDYVNYNNVINLVHQSKEFLKINEAELYYLLHLAHVGAMEVETIEAFNERLYNKIKETNKQFESVYKRLESQ